jgi:hypothetical protein
MEKKTYETPEIEVIELDEQPKLLSASQRSAPMYFDDGEFN